MIGWITLTSHMPNYIFVAASVLFSGLFKIIETQSVPEPLFSRGCRGNRGQFPHEVFCHQYYNCWDGRATIEECPGKLLFNPVISACDYPEAVSCGVRLRNPAPFVTAGGTCLKQWGTFPDPNDCRAFYECDRGRAFHKVCPYYTAFDENVLVCGHAHEVECGGRGGVYGTMAPPLFPYPVSGGSEGSGRIQSRNGVLPGAGASTSWDRNAQQGSGASDGTGRSGVPGRSDGTSISGGIGRLDGSGRSGGSNSRQDSSLGGAISGETRNQGGGGGSSSGGSAEDGRSGASSSGSHGGASGSGGQSGAAGSGIQSGIASSGRGPNAAGAGSALDLPGTHSGRSSGGLAGITGIVDRDISATGQEKQYEKPISPEATFRCPHPRGLYPNALDCTRFWLCREFKPSLLKCPTGQLFDLASLSCMHASKAQCSSIAPRT